MALVGDVERAAGDDRRRVDAVAHVDLGEEILLRRELEDGDVAIFVANVDLAVGDHRRAPARRQHVVRPVWLAGFHVDAVNEPAEVGDHEQAVLDGDGAAGAVHRLVEVELAVAVGVEAGVVPDRGRVGIRPGHLSLLLDDRLIAAVGEGLGGIGDVDGELWARVAALRRVDAPQVADPLTVLRILADGHVNQPIMDDRRADDMVAIGPAAEDVLRFLRIGIELPEELRLAVVTAGVEAIHPAIATAEDHLRDVVDDGVGRARPLAVEDVGPRRPVGPQHLAITLVDAQEARGGGVGEIEVPLVDAVARIDEEEIADGSDAAGTHVVLRDTELLHHVEDPDSVRFIGALDLLAGEGAVVLAVAEALRVEAFHLAAAGDVPEAIPLDVRRAANPLERPVVDAAGRELLTRILPEEAAVVGVEGKETAEIDARWIAPDPALAVVGADVGLPSGDDRIAVALAAELGHPGNVPACLRLPGARFRIELARIPVDGQRPTFGRVVARGGSAPLIPVAIISQRRRDGEHARHGERASHGERATGLENTSG